MMTVHSTIQDYLEDSKGILIVDRQVNNAFGRITKLLPFISRLLILKYCLNVSGSKETSTSSRWTFLQVCPHVLNKDIFNIVFLEILMLRHRPSGDILDLICGVHEDSKAALS